MTLQSVEQVSSPLTEQVAFLAKAADSDGERVERRGDLQSTLHRIKPKGGRIEQTRRRGLLTRRLPG